MFSAALTVAEEYQQMSNIFAVLKIHYHPVVA